MTGRKVLSLAALLLLIGSTMAWADGGVVFDNIAKDGGAGITYERAPSTRINNYFDILNNSGTPDPRFGGLHSIPTPDLVAIAGGDLPLKWHGAPGVAIFDYDRDGDLDIYVTNGPNASNALYSSQLEETGELTFVDVAAEAGVEAFGQDSTGVCYGDIDNDGDHDVYVLGTGQPNILFENQGDGTFHDISAASNTATGVAGELRNPTSCSFTDVDNDSYLDLVVANTFTSWDDRFAHSRGPTYEMMEHNYLFRNNGDNTFTDVSATSGIENVSNMSGPGLTGGAYSWALATADYDLDGDADILFADNQGAAPQNPDEERGYLRLYDNDGAGNFTEVTYSAGTDEVGGWMGLDFADLNCDGNLDFFATDVGYAVAAPSKWFFGQSDGTFHSPGVGDLGMTPFGWGVSAIDYDNDGDSDIVYHGGMHTWTIVLADNPGVVLQNTGDCSGVFDWDASAIPVADPSPAHPAFPAPLTDHTLRIVEGVASGDLNQDGFQDVVSVARMRINADPAGPPRLFPGVGPPFFNFGPGTGGPFDAVAYFEAVYAPVPPLGIFLRLEPVKQHFNGDLAIDVNSGDNGNGWAEVNLVGSAGILNDGTVNRDGIGAVVSFTPAGGQTSLRPIIGGASYASQNSLAAGFGLGDAADGTVEVLWPGGDRNCLHDVADGERVLVPHIPCSYDGNWKNFGKYNSCVMQALNEYKQEGLIDAHYRNRLRDSARQAFNEGACQ